MSASITISGLSWAPPGGDRLFDGLDLQFGAERAGLVGRNGVGKTTMLRLIAGDLRPASGTITVNGSLAVVRQQVQVGPQEIVADLFGARAGLNLLRKAEAGTASIDELAAADWTLDERITAMLEKVGLPAAAETPLVALSGGQRTRAGLAGAMFAEPDFLILDEPTNNLDREGRAAVGHLIEGWRGGAIVVSHDRELLDVMDVIVEMTTLGVTRYGGNFSHYRDRKAVELAAAQQALSHAEKQIGEVARKAQQAVERKDKRDAAGARKGAKGDMPRILVGARKERAELSRGDNRRLAVRQAAIAGEEAQQARERIEILENLSIALPPTGLPANATVLEIDAVTVGYVPSDPLLDGISLVIRGPERVAVAGPNGSGKTTLLKLITGELKPWAGSVRVTDRCLMLDQRAAILDPDLSVLDNFSRLNPGSDENGRRAALARFLFRGDASLQITGTLSGGQMLRAGLACTLGGTRPPQLLILDEPTNHLDLTSIEAIEAGLAGFDGALIVVSHDLRFLDAIGVERTIDLAAGR